MAASTGTAVLLLSEDLWQYTDRSAAVPSIRLGL